MNIILGKTAGFCYGVTRAIQGAEEEIKKNDKIYCLGEIVHNKNVIKKLEEKGIQFIDKIEEAKGKTIIRAHGIPKETYQKAEEMGIQIKDLTCPHVLKIHKIAEEYCKKGFFIILLGKENHPEVIGITSFCGENSALITDNDEIEYVVKRVEKLGMKNVLIIAQTTFNSKKFDDIVKTIQEKLHNNVNLKIEKTICPATEIRQKETEEIARNVDAMVIIGDKKSSNTNKLHNIASKFCEKVIFVQSSEEIALQELKNATKIGVMAGASTPKEDIDGVINILENGGKNE
ncbi:MAG: 4-hydroxy-3-methylbut-2-enyl diphosphate reductase [Clostridia bacterium]|nr:4-hydroxy-3-methylbut-2-enyl diphosphate reductase [Clostridia bacterium]